MRTRCTVRSAKGVVVILGLALFLSTDLLGAGRDLLLTANGKAEATIVLGKDVSPTEAFAASELKKYLCLISGAEFEIAEDGEGTLILVGMTDQTRKLVSEEDLSRERLGDDGYFLKRINNKLILTGRRPRGTLYAVYELLEMMGCRWPSPGDDVIPRQTTIEIGRLDEVHKPDLSIRSGPSCWSCGEGVDWIAKMKMNTVKHYQGSGNWDKFKSDPGYLAEIEQRDLDINFGIHTLHFFLPPDSEHPEYLPLIKGKRQNGQLCLTNPDVVDLMGNSILQFVEEHPEVDVIQLDPRDGYGWCECEKCDAVDPKGECKIHSGWQKRTKTYLAFVNKVAQRVYKKCPDKYIGALAYGATGEIPEGIKPYKNVIVWFCPYWRCSAHSIDNPQCRRNRLLKEALEGWIDATEAGVYLYGYYYGMGAYAGMPLPILHTMSRDWKYYRQIGIRGMVTFASRPVYIPNSYMFGKLAWNIDADVDAILEDYCMHCFGKAGKWILSYYQAWENAMAGANCIIPSWPNVIKLLNDDRVKTMDTCLHRAEMSAQAKDVRLRIARIRNSFTQVKLVWSAYGHFYSGQEYILSGDLDKAESEISKAAQRYAETHERLRRRRKEGCPTALEYIRKVKEEGISANPELCLIAEERGDSDGTTDAVLIDEKSRIVSVFQVKGPAEPTKFILRGVNGDHRDAPEIQIRLNDKVIFEATSPFNRCAWDDKDDEWITFEVAIPAGCLLYGKNTLEVRNSGPAWWVLDYIHVR